MKSLYLSEPETLIEHFKDGIAFVKYVLDEWKWNIITCTAFVLKVSKQQINDYISEKQQIIQTDALCLLFIQIN